MSDKQYHFPPIAERERFPKPDDFVPVPDFPKGHFHHGKPRCQAWNPNRGAQCMGLAMVSKNRDKCRKHGGKSLSGIAHPSTKRIKWDGLPKDLYEKVAAAVDDPELLNLSQDIGLVDGRLQQLVAKLGSKESGAVWDALSTKMQELEAANAMSKRYPEESEMRQRKAAEAAQALADIKALITRGYADWAIWKDIDSMLFTKMRLVQTEGKRRVDMQVLIKAERALALATALGQAVKDEVDDYATRQRINDRFQRILAEGEIEVPVVAIQEL